MTPVVSGADVLLFIVTEVFRPASSYEYRVSVPILFTSYAIFPFGAYFLSTKFSGTEVSDGYVILAISSREL